MSEFEMVEWAEARLAELSAMFRQLGQDDQDLVLALVRRLAGHPGAEYPPDVPFMDFDQ